jgi:hypothetical protein
VYGSKSRRSVKSKTRRMSCQLEGARSIDRGVARYLVESSTNNNEARATENRLTNQIVAVDRPCLLQSEIDLFLRQRTALVLLQKFDDLALPFV